jgi:hypothetical protein
MPRLRCGPMRERMTWIGKWLAAMAIAALAGCGGGSGEATATADPQTAVATLRAQSLALAAGNLSAADAANQLMDFAQGAYRQFFPTAEPTLSSAPFLYRYYPATGVYLGVVVSADGGYSPGGVYVMGGPFGNAPAYVGPLASFITPVCAPGATGGNYFPLPAGSRWIYTSTGATSPTIVSVAGTQLVAGRNGVAVETVDGSDGSVTQDLYVVSSAGVDDYTGPGADPVSQALSGIRLMTFPIEVGAQYSQADITVDSGIDFDGDGKTDAIRVQAGLTVAGFESVSNFGNALHQREDIVETLIPSSGLASVDAHITIDGWYVDGVGLVQEVSHTTGSGVNHSTTRTLTAYRVGTCTADTTAPSAIAVSPAAATMRASNAVVSVTFDEAMYAGSITPSTFAVLDSANVPVPGQSRLVGNTLTFTPARAWASGTYSARITTGATDLVGNPLAAGRTWTFTIDASGPSIVSSMPAEGAQDVRADAVLRIQFSEPIDPASIADWRVQLSDDQSYFPVGFAVTGSTLTVTPSAPLALGKSYHLNMTGLTDLLGNAMEPATLRFTTTQGRFAWPSTVDGLPGVGTVNAVGDVNGDGIADLLIATGSSAPTELYVLYGRTDGSLGTAVKIPLPGIGFITDIQIGDVNGDGRPDVVLGGGMGLVLHQTASGSLAAGEVLDRWSPMAIRIGDLDRNGKNVVVGIDESSSMMTIWRRDSTGTLALSTTIDLGTEALGRGVQIADVNGDGLPDIVAWLGSFRAGDIEIFLQGPQGTFGAPILLNTGSVMGAQDVAIADINGDGRVDIVAATGGANSPAYLAAFYQNPSGGFGSMTKIPAFDSSSQVRIVDVTGDGRADIVVGRSGGWPFGVLAGQAGGSFGAEALFAAPYQGSLAIADLNHDGLQDIVLGGSVILQLPLQITAQAAAAARVTNTAMGAAIRKALPH